MTYTNNTQVSNIYTQTICPLTDTLHVIHHDFICKKNYNMYPGLIFISLYVDQDIFQIKLDLIPSL